MVKLKHYPHEQDIGITVKYWIYGELVKQKLKHIKEYVRKVNINLLRLLLKKKIQCIQIFSHSM